MLTAAPSILWRLVGPTGHVSECQIWELPSGHFQIRLVHDREPEATERYNTRNDAIGRASAIANRFVERGWRDAAM